MSVPAHLKYTKDHFWIRLEGEMAVIGLTDYGLAELGMIMFIELAERNFIINRGQFTGVMETVSENEQDMLAPLTGEVTAVNMLLERTTLPLYESPYDKGWLYKVRWMEEAELDQLWDAETYSLNYL